MNARNVFALGRPPSENALRDAFAAGLARVQGPASDQDAADRLGWSIGTVRNCRNRTNSLSAKLISDAYHHAGADFIGPFLALHGARAVPLASVCDTDAGTHCALAKLAVKIAVALDDASHGGKHITPREARDMLDELDTFQAHMDRIRKLAAQVDA
jgi:hypothetical protein